MTSIGFENATLGYKPKTVLKDVTLAVNPGEVFGVVGPNGVGKSTLIKSASGILPPLSGHILMDGQVIHQLAPPQRAKRLAVVPQATQLPSSFRAEDVVLMGRTPYLGWFDREGETDIKIASEAMERTNTAQLFGRLIGELSGGEQQRILIARALTQTPAILLLDEPTAHLDLKHQDEVLQLIRSLAEEQGIAVILTLHDLNLVARFTDQVALLSDGEVRKIGEPTEVLTPDELAPVYGIEIHVTSHPLHGTPLILS
jgi:iron complex transport system ATP-binding protein